MCVTDSLHAWFGLFERSSLLTYGKVLYTTNGGANFLISSLPSLGSEIRTLEFKYDNNFGFSTLPYQYNYYYKSTNGGSTWVSQYSVLGFGSASRVKWIPNTNVWYVSIDYLGPDHRIFKTTNDGAVWSVMNLPNQQFLVMDMDLISYNNKVIGYALGFDGQVIRLNDTATVIGINNISTKIPSSYMLEQNYPNPFNPTTNIHFSIPKAGFTSIRIYDILGKLVHTLFEEQLSPGSFKAEWDATQMPSGIYVYRIESGSYTQCRKMILIK